MIKVGIAGADTPIAGELLRLLINHPEIEITTLYAPLVNCRSVASVHHGFIGEKIIDFSDRLEPENLDILFITKTDDFSEKIRDDYKNWPDLKIVDLTYTALEDLKKDLSEIGLSEINRKNLVRGATRAIVVTPDIVAPLISLLPLANYMLLNSTLSVSLSVPTSILKENLIHTSHAKILAEAIRLYQPGFNSPVILSFDENKEEERIISMKILLDCPLSIEEIERIYDGVYDDHNFTFVVHSPVSTKEVEGTQKCVISLNKPTSATLEISAVIDGRMRGGAGDGIHMLNLLSGLYEKTGLALKSSAFLAPSDTQSSSWFA